MDVTAKRSSIVFLAALLLQFAHFIEHIAQFYQHAVLNFSIKESRGILFFADLEWNHFTFNLLYFLLLAYPCFKMRYFEKKSVVGPKNQFFRILFLSGFYLQGYHVLEHAARIGQTLQSNCTPCPGLLGWYIDGIYLHFYINLITLALPLAAFVGLKTYRNLYPQKTAVSV